MERIASLEGLGEITVIQGSGGANRSGGADTWFPGAPFLPSTGGLSAYIDEDQSYLFAAMDVTDTAPDMGPNSLLDDDTMLNAYVNEMGLSAPASQKAHDQALLMIQGSGGANRSGGSDTWFQGQPFLPSTGGLSAASAPQRVVSASQGANYSGGSSWFPGAPLMPSSQGLAQLALSVISSGPRRAGNPSALAAAIVSASTQIAPNLSGCDRVRDVAMRAAIAAGYDPYFARDFANKAGDQCLAAVRGRAGSNT